MYSLLDLSEASGPLFLQEIGVFTPWENVRLLDQDLALPGHGISPTSDSRWERVQEACQKSQTFTDKMAKTRKDWGELPVYCIDDVNAEEIDDGVSLERIPGSNDTFWVHIHVANPTAFIDPDNMIMKYAASRIQTLYVPDRTYPMLPKSLTQNHFSLAPGRPSLTFR
jgi:exoribonuclease R